MDLGFGVLRFWVLGLGFLIFLRTKLECLEEFWMKMKIKKKLSFRGFRDLYFRV